MPFAERIPFGSVGSLPDLEPEPEEAPPLREIVPAAFRIDNTVASLLSREEAPSGATEGYDPFADIDGYEEFADAFVDVADPVEATRVKAQIDRELADRATLASAGGLGVAASIAAGMLDPIVLLPVGGAGAVAGKNLLRAGARTAAAGFVGSAAAEVALHQSQDVRDFGESAVNISAATLLSGLLGGALGRLSVAERATATREVRDVVAGGMGADDIQVPKVDLDAAAGGDPAPMQLRLANSLGAARASAWLKASPSVEIMVNSRSEAARRAMAQLADIPMAFEGVENPISAESITRAFDSMRGQLARENHVGYRNYRRRLAGKAPLEFTSRADFRNRSANALTALADVRLRGRPERPMSRKAFKERVGEIVRNGGKGQFGDPPEAVALAKRYGQAIDDVKEMAVKAGILPEGVKVETAAGYLTRVYKAELLRQDPNDRFREIAASWFQRQHPELTREEALAAADDVKEHILGTPGGRVMYQPVAFKQASPLKARVFDIPDFSIREFLEQDVEEVFDRYVRTMAPDIALARLFPVAEESAGSGGNFAATKAYKEIVDEYEGLIQGAEPKDRTALYKRRDTDLRKIQQVWDLLRGVNTASSSIAPDALSRRISRGVRQSTYLALGGSFAINSITDVGRIVATQGVMRTLRHAILPFAQDIRGVSLVKQELEQAGAIFETLLDTRAASMVDIGDEFRGSTRFERGLSAAANNFSLLNLLSPWTTITKQLAGMVVHQRILDVAEAVGRGAGKAKDARDLAQLGISPDMARRIAAQYAKHGKVARSVSVSNTQNWIDAQAVETFRIALRRATDQIIVTPGIGDRPIPLVTTEWGKLISQFRTFSFAAVNRSLIPMMQELRHFDVATMNGIMLQTALGAFVYAFAAKSRGRELPDASTDEGMRLWVAEAVDRSGLLGFYSDMNNIAEVLSRGTIGINAIAGGPVLSRYASRNYLGAIFGPQVSRMEDIANLTGALSNGEATESDVKALRRLIPYQNLFYLDRLFDHAESALVGSLGIPEKRRPR